MRQRRVDDSEAAADRLDGQMEQLHQRRERDERDKRARDAAIDERPELDDRDTQGGDQHRPGVHRVEVGDQGFPLAQEVRGDGAHPESQKVADLAHQDDQRDAAREAEGDRIGNELDGAAQAEQPERHEHGARHEGGYREAVQSVPLDDRIHDDDERARRPADLHPRAPQRRDEEARHDRGVEPALGRYAARDGEGDREGQGDDADDYAGGGVGDELPAGVAPERGDKLGDEHGETK